MKIVYVAMSADFIHHGHMNIIEKARTLGKVVVGLLTDKAISEHKRIPYLNYKQRKKIISNIVGVEKIISQNTRSYTKNLKLIKPDFVVHGDDWKEGFRKNVRTEVLRLSNKTQSPVEESKLTGDIFYLNKKKIK